MNECEKILLDSLNSYMNGQQSETYFDASAAESLIKLSRMQKVFPIFYLENSGCLERVLSPQRFAGIKTEIMLGVSAQIQRNAEILRVYNLLKENGIDCIVFKGAVLRTLYSRPEYRISADEDILTDENDIEKSIDLLTSNGYELLEFKNGEAKLMNKSLKSLLELHTSLVDESISDEYRKIGEMFRAQKGCPVMTDIGCGEIASFSPSYGFLSLCVHFFNHFVMGGIGIRPVMDIACFIKNFEEEIDFDFCFTVLKTINADKLIRTVIALCGRLFGVECRYAENEKLTDDLLRDILDAGAYGTADESRVHGGTVTRSQVYGGKGKISSVFSVAFPSDSDIAASHPELEGRKAEIRKYRIKRIVGFAGKKGKLNVLQSTGKRKRLLKSLGILT